MGAGTVIDLPTVAHGVQVILDAAVIAGHGPQFLDGDAVGGQRGQGDTATVVLTLRVLGQRLRRPPRVWQRANGRPSLLAESFVNPAQVAGT